METLQIVGSSSKESIKKRSPKKVNMRIDNKKKEPLHKVILTSTLLYKFNCMQ